MDIAIDVRSLMEGRHSGVEEYTTQLIRGMVRVNPSHTYHLFYNAARKVVLPSFPSSVVVHSFRYPNKLFNLAQFLASQPTWDRLVQADCFFVPNIRLTPLTVETPLVTCVHDLSFERFPEFFSWRRRMWHHLMRPRMLLDSSDHVIAVSEATKRDVVDLYGIASKRVTVVHSGVALGSRSVGEATASVRPLYQLPDRFVLFLATLEPRKNVDSLIRAFDAIAHTIPHNLVIAGVRGWRMHAIEQAYASARHRHRIHFIGFVEERDKQALYRAADLFVYPSLYEGFGFPPLEALIAGTPVITSRNSALPEVVGEWATLINPDDTAELALVMRELLGDPPIVSDEVQEHIQRRYSWNRAALETLAVIEQVV